jgi:hypothetical protein
MGNVILGIPARFWRYMVSPDTLARLKACHLQAERRSPGIHHVFTLNRHCIRFIQGALALVGILLVLLWSEAARHWIAESAATFCVVGGFIAAPILTITAWIGMIAPNLLLLHRASTLLFLIALIWLALAFISAHLHHSRQQAQEDHHLKQPPRSF